MPEKIIDLTLKLEDNMPTHKFFQSPIIARHLDHDSTLKWNHGGEDDSISTATTFLGMTDHVGTHVDAPFHNNPDGATIDEMPIDNYFGKAVCFDLTHIPDLGEITAEDLEEAEKKSGVKVDGHIVLLNTGVHNRHYPDPKVCWSNPGITAEATHWMADRGSKLHGVEGPSTDMPSNNKFPNHRACRDRGITHYEWLVNLDKLVGVGEFMFYGIPLKISEGSGSPVRAYAVINE